MGADGEAGVGKVLLRSRVRLSIWDNVSIRVSDSVHIDRYIRVRSGAEAKFIADGYCAGLSGDSNPNPNPNATLAY